MNETLTGRSLKDLSPDEITDLITIAGLDTRRLCVPPEFNANKSRHTVYHVIYSLERIGAEEAREKLTLGIWPESGEAGIHDDSDPDLIEIYAGYIIGEWGGNYAPVEVVKWFILHGFYFAAEGRAAGMIAAERIRHAAKGFTTAHDDLHTDGSLITAASCYMGMGYGMLVRSNKPIPPAFVPRDWPWQPEDWKTPENPIRAYVIAASLIAAETDRVLRIIDGRPAVQIEPGKAMEIDALAVKRAFPQSLATEGESGKFYVWSMAENGTCLGTGATEADAWAEAAANILHNR